MVIDLLMILIHEEQLKIDCFLSFLINIVLIVSRHLTFESDIKLSFKKYYQLQCYDVNMVDSFSFTTFTQDYKQRPVSF